MILRTGFKLGKWTIYPLEGRLHDDEESRRIQPKSMDVLVRLAEADGEVVTREELLRQVWGERAVTDEPLTRCIGELRRALGDSREEPHYVLTVPKRGYRLLQPIVALPEREQSTPEAQPPSLTVSQKAHRWLTVKRLVLGLGVLILAAVVQIAIERLLDRPATVEAPESSIAKRTSRSIVVLPFADMSASGDQEYMSDGIAEELLNLLARIPQLRVISRSSAFSFKGKAIDIRSIAEQLDVAYVLEGSVRTSGDTIRITAQLIEARTDTHLWSETYERELTDIFVIQDEIAKAVVGQLELTILGNTPKPRQTDPEAYSLFLQARHLHEQPGGDSFMRAFDFYKAALGIDENYVPAWVWLAALYDDTVNSSGLPYEEVGRLARDAIERALAIDPDDPLALGMSGLLLRAWDNDLTAAAAQMQRALEFDPNNPILLRWAAILLNGLGRHDEAVGVTEYLFARDPVGNISKVNLSGTYILAGRYEDAIRICEIQAAVSAIIGPCRSNLITAYVFGGDAESALVQLQQASSARVRARLAPLVYHGLGRQAEFETALAELRQIYADGDKPMASWIALGYASAGDADAAFDWLDQATEDGTVHLSPTSPYFSELKSDPRWDALLATLGSSPADLDAIRLDVTVPR